MDFQNRLQAQKLTTAPGSGLIGVKGLPLVGHALEVQQDIQTISDRNTRRYGSVFLTLFLGETWINN